MAKKTKIKTTEIRGIKLDIYVDEYGNEILVKKLQDATKPERKSLNIEFWRLQRGSGKPPEIVHGVITGKHATNSNMLVRIDGEKGSKQESFYSYGRRNNEEFLRLTEAQREQLLKVATELADAEKRLGDMLTKWSFDPREEVTKALKKLGVTED